MASEVDIWNLALTYLDLSDVVHSPNDQGEAAAVCKRWYNHARRKVLASAHWDFAMKFPALALVLDQTTLPTTTPYPYPGWRYVYRRPQDCLRFLSVSTQYGIRANPFPAFWWNLCGASGVSANSWGPWRPPFSEMLDTIGTPANQAINIVTDQSAAFGVYVADVTNVNIFSPHLREAIAWELAIPIAGPLSANQNAKKNAEVMARASLTSALGVTLNEKQPDPYPNSPAITCRN